jgi:hypothetical protein
MRHTFGIARAESKSRIGNMLVIGQVVVRSLRISILLELSPRPARTHSHGYAAGRHSPSTPSTQT